MFNQSSEGSEQGELSDFHCKVMIIGTIINFLLMIGVPSGQSFQQGCASWSVGVLVILQHIT